VSDETPTKKTAREKAALLLQMTKEAKRVERRVGAEACVVICIFKEENNLTFQDAGRFPMPPEHFYKVMQNAHKQNLLNLDGSSKIIKPH
jgi:hypothetical protein